VARLVDTATATGAIVTGVDVADSDGDRLTVNLTADTRDSKHRNELVAKLEEIDGVVVRNVGDSTFLTHVGGKIEIASKYPIHNRRDLARVYTPGVARVCKAIYDHPERARMLTIKKNTVAVVTDGTAVLGLGDIGPSAAMPVMEGKAVLFKQFGNVDVAEVLDIKGFNLNAVLEVDPDFLESDEHTHSDAVSSFVFKSKKPFDGTKLEEFLGGMIQVFGPDLLRYKGVLYIKGTPRRMVFQGVHMMMGADVGRKWEPHETPSSKMVFIGRNLPKDTFIAGLKQCLA